MRCYPWCVLLECHSRLQRTDWWCLTTLQFQLQSPFQCVSTTTRRFGRYDQIHNTSLHAGFILNLHKVYQAGHYFTCLSRNKLTEPVSLEKNSWISLLKVEVSPTSVILGSIGNLYGIQQPARYQKCAEYYNGTRAFVHRHHAYNDAHIYYSEYVNIYLVSQTVLPQLLK